jgi:hypothetical protein
MMDTVRVSESGTGSKSYRNGKSHKDAEALGRLRRLEIRLPVSHPIWSIPAGARAAYVRQVLDLGILLSHQGEIEARLIRLENRLAPSDESVTTTSSKESPVDVGTFTNAICDL